MILAMELAESPLDRTLTTLVAVPLGLLLLEELRGTKTVKVCGAG